MWLCILDIINSTLGRLFLVLMVDDKGHPGQAHWGGGTIVPIHLQPGARWRWVGSTTFLLIYPRERARYLLSSWLNGPRVLFGGFDLRTVHPVVSRYTHYVSTDITYQNWARASKTDGKIGPDVGSKSIDIKPITVNVQVGQTSYISKLWEM